ncbi:mandelate racemase/muconate lactonizing enzyme family protein [Pollutimonas thiosulfatoxidans]|nr:mandelate racemase/muconate lactonizing enzyme family protein [Pollutimonas thiosulfatoxidans]
MAIIRDIECIKLSYIPRYKPIDGLATIGSRDVFLVKIITDQGLYGIGESFALGSLDSLEAIVNETLKPVLVGEDCRDVGRLWAKMYRTTFRYGRRGIVLAAISGVDIALWDLSGKICHQPVYKLAGGYRDQITAYASGGYYLEGRGIDALTEEAQRYLDQGFTMMKMKVGAAPLDVDLERIKQVQNVIGDKLRLGVDANAVWDFNTALEMGRKFEDLGIAFFEEPVSSDHIEDSIRLAQLLDTPIAGYETELTHFGMRDFIARHAVDIVQTDAIWAGGITEALRIATLASAWNKPVIPHFSASAVSLAANLHFGAAISNCELIELTQDENPLRDELLIDPISVKKGVVYLPSEPGLGIELNEETVSRFRVK